MRVRLLLTLAFVGAAAVVANGCSTGAIDVEGCKQIEEARCRQAPACNIPITPPYFTTDGDVDACIRYYDTACLHGLVGGDPGNSALDACVAAIQGDSLAKDGCAIVKEPQTDTVDCGWLLPAVPATVDASDDAADAADDAATDASGD